MPSVSLAVAAHRDRRRGGERRAVGRRGQRGGRRLVAGAGVRTTTLSKTPVAAVEASWLVTASPTYIVDAAIVIVPT